MQLCQQVGRELPVCFWLQLRLSRQSAHADQQSTKERQVMGVNADIEHGQLVLLAE